VKVIKREDQLVEEQGRARATVISTIEVQRMSLHDSVKTTQLLELLMQNVSVVGPQNVIYGIKLTNWEQFAS